MTKNTALLLVGSMEFRRNDLNFAIRNLKFAILLGALLLALSFPAEAQQPGKVYRVGYLGTTTRSLFADAFEQGMRDHGYEVGKNLTLIRQ